MSAVTLYLILSLAAAGTAAGTTTAPATAALELVDASPVRTVRFIGGAGQTAIVVRNRSGRPGLIELEFVTNQGDLVGVTARTAASPPLSVGDPETLTRTLPPGASRSIVLRLRLGARQRPVDGGGVLYAGLSDVEAPPLAVRLRGAPPDITFDPAHITIDVSQACWLVGGTCGDTQTVLVRGKDARAWAEWASDRPPTGLAILNNSHGGSVRVRLGSPKVLEGGIVSMAVDASDLNEAGRYAGRLPLDPGDVHGPALAIAVKVRWSLSAAVSVIFLGALVGGFFLRRFEIYRRRRLLELELRSALHRYDEVLAESDTRPASYDLDRLLGPRRHDEAETLPYPGTRGVSAILWHIRTARDDEDFTEDIERTHALIGQIERWLTLEPVVREAVDVLDDSPPARRAGEFPDCQAHKDLATLRMRATTPPGDDDGCEWLVAALAEQGRVTIKCKLIWELLARLESRTGWSHDQATTLRELDLFTIEERFHGFEERSSTETAELRVALDNAEQRLRRLSSDAQVLLEQSPRVANALRIEARLEATERNPTIERQMLDVPVWRLRLEAAFNQLALRSLLWTLARALVASVAYALTVYSDTWGTVTDFASAFTVGFLTETFVNWAVMPAFRSFRHRRARSADAAEHGAAEPEVPGEGAEADEARQAPPTQPLTSEL